MRIERSRYDVTSTLRRSLISLGEKLHYSTGVGRGPALGKCYVVGRVRVWFNAISWVRRGIKVGFCTCSPTFLFLFKSEISKDFHTASLFTITLL